MWVKSTDFDSVCDYACVDIERMREQLISLAGLGPLLARKYGSKLRQEIIAD